MRMLISRVDKPTTRGSSGQRFAHFDPVAFPSRSAPTGHPATLHCACGGSCPHCVRETQHPAGAVELRDRLARAARSPSERLPETLRANLEHQLNADLAQVEIHTGQESIDLARDLSADALSYGRHIHFGDKAFAPSTAAGDALIAHEVHHVARGGSATGPDVSHPGEPEERRADTFSRAFVADRESSYRIAGRREPKQPANGTTRVFRRSSQRQGPVRGFQPSSGLGILNGDFSPGTPDGAGLLTVTLRVSLDFLPSASPRGDQRHWRSGWTPLQEQAYRGNYRALIEHAWSRRYQLRRTQRRRVTHAAEVDVRVEIVPRRDADFQVTVLRQDPEDPQRDFVVHPAGIGEVDPATGRATGRLRAGATAWDSGLRSTPDIRHSGSRSGPSRRQLDAIYFPSGSSALDATRLVPLRERVREELRSGYGRRGEKLQIEMSGYSDGSEPGPRSRATLLALQRAESVRDQLLRSISDHRVEIVAIPRVPITTGSVESRHRVEVWARWTRGRTAVHEAGHMLGLGDEYVETGRLGQSLDDEASHSALSQSLNLDPVLVGRDAQSIMASGARIRPHHYATFAELLARITGTPTREWRVVPTGTPLGRRR